MKNISNELESIAELVCELTRNCSMKEEYFAASFNLSPTEVRLLKLFTNASQYSIKELCETLNLTPGRITHILSSLEEKKLVIRKQNQTDKRNYYVELLPKANPLINNLHKNYISLHESILQNVGEKELKQIQSSLKLLTEQFKQWVEKK